MVVQDTPWYGGLARNVLVFDMVVFHDQFSKDSSLRSRLVWMSIARMDSKAQLIRIIK
ncbi:hypothetical protein NC652_004367 [Populus alba x Populus x berolinensis]|nr:hypothetical protein NC651_004267 [Populus alba x Populus x berolinensis]KAJ6966784.1 hypothetical protein NC652_004367 [Populus alba x Populus x berolinensis]